MKKILSVVVVMVALAVWFFSGRAPDPVYAILPGYAPDPDRLWEEDPFAKSSVTQQRLPDEVVGQRLAAQRLDENGGDNERLESRPDQSASKVILFGDTHVHTTNSMDAFFQSLPSLQGGQGALPPSYACDYARYVAQLDFYFLSDHAEHTTSEQWNNAIDSVIECNRLSGANPDVFAFMGWEWSQVGPVAEAHYGHHNVLFKDYAKDQLPARPIGAIREGSSWANKLPRALQLLDPRHKDYYASFNRYIDSVNAREDCPTGIPSPQLPPTCKENVRTPAELYRKLDEWGFDTLVIPHGSSWGLYTPPNANWEHQLTAENMDEEKGRLIEVYSGHGNSEQYASFEARTLNADGSYSCPEPTADYLPACWQAGEIIRKRCLNEGLAGSVCEERAQESRRLYVEDDTIYGFATVPGATAEEWLDAGQARNMFLPSFNYRPKKSVQYGLALRNFDGDGEPLKFQWGFIGSTDTHSARPGHGFKQKNRSNISDANGASSPFWESLSLPDREAPVARSRALNEDQIAALKMRAKDVERVSSYLSVGGLAAVHADSHSRDGIWQGMKRKETYATSGHKILLWFDLIGEGEASNLPMGSSVTTKGTPHFQVKVAGSFKQLPGCPAYVEETLEKKRLLKMALGECYNPSDERYSIEKIEVVRIRPQSYQGESVENLIEDPWMVHECEAGQETCEFSFSDEEFSDGNRDALYYVRAIEEPIDMINAKNLRTVFDDRGDAVETSPCYGDYRTSSTDDCLAKAGHRAWSSPIFVEFGESPREVK